MIRFVLQIPMILAKSKIAIISFLLLGLALQAQVFIPFGYWQKVECNALQTQAYSAAGTYTLTVPNGCQKMNVYSCGGGGGNGTK